MNKVDRIKKVIDHLIAKDVVDSQKGFAEKLNYTESYVSDVLSSDDKLTKPFVNKFVKEFGVSKEYLDSGKGEMFTNKESDISSQLDKARNKLNSGHGEPIPEGVMGKVSRFLRKYNPSLGSWLEAKLINQETITPSDQALAIQAMQDIRKDQQEIDELLKSMKEDVGNMLKENQKSNDGNS